MSMYIRRMAILMAALMMFLSFSFSASAETQTGWISRGGSWYYYSANGKQAKSQWLRSGTDLFWIQDDGVMATNTWIQSGEDWYYMGASGSAVSGWQEINDKYYYFDKTTYVMATNTTVDSWYVGADGAWDPSK